MSDAPEREPLDVDRAAQLLTQYRELSEIYGSLAHEIKNPLSVIRMNMDLLAEDFAEPKSPTERRVQQRIGVVQGQCERLQNMLDDFLKFARVRKLDLLPGSLNRVIERVLDFFEPQATQQGIEIVRYLDPELPSILLDSQILYAALLNLVKNAFEAMPDGGQLVVRTRLVLSGVALDLIDTGCGMDEQTALRMFEAFYSTKSGGSGLGLPTTRRIIDAHGGQIDVHSEVGRGTQFTLTFPVPARIADERAKEKEKTSH
jgi:signal transduction histidine kinase